MPFDSTASLPQLAPVFEMPASGKADAFVSPIAFENSKRQVAIQRFVNFAAVALFGAAGVLAGTALVILMLVALVIPATIAVTLTVAAFAAAVILTLVWFKRRVGNDGEEPRAFAAA